MKEDSEFDDFEFGDADDLALGEKAEDLLPHVR